MNDTYAAFHEFFELVEANSAELRQEVYHLRYRVLCVEVRLPGFDAACYQNELEEDEYDLHSAHILLRHRPSNSFIGTARLILQDPLNPNKPFPIENHAHIDSKRVDISKFPRRYVAEISRFAILAQFSRRRLGQHKDRNQSIYKKCATMDRRRFPNTCLALVVGIIHMSTVHKIDHLLSVMDPSLNRLMSYYGLNLRPVGPLTDYHGMRRPHYVKLFDVMDGLYKYHRDIWELVSDYGRACPYSMAYIQPEKVQVFDNMMLLNN